MIRCFALVSVSYLLAANPRAQWFAQLPSENVPVSQANTRGVDVADLDGDGNADIVFLRDFAPPLVYRNLGGGRFVEGGFTFPNFPGEAHAMRLCDVDGNGTPDFVGARMLGRVVLWRNQGGVFTDVSTTAMPATTMQSMPTGIVPIDIDGDHDLDLFITCDSRGYLFVNDGTGVFTDGSARLPQGNVPMGEAVAVDIDGDGDLDLVIARISGTATDRHLVYLNNGSGVFSDASARMPPFGPVLSPGGLSLAAGDIDGDGNMDVIAGVGQSNLVVYRNTGGAFTVAASLPLAGIDLSPYYVMPHHLRLGDVDGDLDLDLVFDGNEYGRHLFLNDGHGNFAPAPIGNLPQVRQILRGAVLRDIDGDQDLDLVQAITGVTLTARPLEAQSVAFNDGHGRFFDVGRNPLPPTVDEATAVLAVDLDRDGIDDIVHAIGIGGPNAPIGMLFVYKGMGDGTLQFRQRVEFDENLGGARALAAGDVDGDGFPDVYAGLHSGANLLLRNQGNGQLVVSGTLPATTSRAHAAKFADFDGDGDLDLVTTRVTGSVFSPSPAQTTLWLNDGSGTFTDVTAAAMPAETNVASEILVFDLQQDGDLDLFLGSQWNPGPGCQHRLLVNNGNGTFTNETAARLPALGNNVLAGAAAGDLDGDGRTDLMLAMSGLRVLIDQGHGVFADRTAQWDDIFFTSYGRIAAFDVDHDGRIDLVNTAPEPKFMRNLPAGRFQAQANTAPPILPVQFSPQFPALGDFDGDGEPDLLHAGQYLGMVHWNLRHHISIPLVPKPGLTVPLRLYADPGHNPTARPAFFAASPGRLRSTTPFGTLWLDPMAPIQIIAAVVPAPAGVAEVPLRIGSSPDLQGLEFTAQGLVMTADLGWAEFTNPLSATIR